ncbi:MAG: HEAT repeat domain-containing protein [Promethearchaeota archaeon]|nr:MAG: HEAT repeat domain-containing protein [Candidatus Lokiarchaeota archaeon]
MADTKLHPREIFQKREQLGLTNSMKMLSQIIETDKDNQIRNDAIKIMGKISEQSNELKKYCFETLENLLISDDSLEIKCSTAKVLGNIRYEKAIKPLKWVIEQKTTDIDVKEACLKAIADIKFQKSEINLFINELNAKSTSLKECVKNELLTLTPDDLIPSLMSAIENDEYSEKHKMEIINLIGLELASLYVAFEDLNYLNIKYPEIISLLKQNKVTLLETIVPNVKQEDTQILDNSLTILKVLGNSINKDLIKFLRHDDFIIKKNAINLIGKLQIKEGVGVLLNNLDDVYDEVNKAIIEALGNIGEISAVPDLLKVLNIEDFSYEYLDFDMKWEIMDAIRNIYIQNKDTSYEYLLENIDTDNDILKESVAYILGELENEEFVEPLLKLLDEKNLDTRKNAAIALGKIGDKRAIQELIDIVYDENNYWLLKKVAIDAIFNIYLKNLFEESKMSIEVNREFIQSTEKLIDYLKTTQDHCRVKLSAIKLLEVFGGKTAIDALIKQLDDFHRIVRISSSKAINKIEKRLKKKKKTPNQIT